MDNQPFIVPTFTFDAFQRNRLNPETHVVIAPKEGESQDPDSTSLMDQLKGEGIEIDTPYEPFFTDGAPPPEQN
jgi:hypothetical protein